MQYIFVVVLGLGTILPSGIIAVASLVAGSLNIAAVVQGLVFGVMTLVMFWVFRTMSSTRVILGEDAIRYVTYRKDVQIGYDEITGMKFPAIPYMGGWMKVMNPIHDIRLTVVFEDLDEFVRLLKERLDATDNQQAYDRRKLFRFYKTAGFATQSWDRIYQFFIPMTVATVLICLFWGFVAPLIFAEMTVILYLLAMISIIGVFSGWAIAEILLLIPFIRSSNEAEFSIPERDSKVERNWIAAGYGIFFALAALGSLPFIVLLC